MSFTRLRKLHGKMYERRVERERRQRQKDALKATSANTFFLVGTPIHPNVGDSAIVLAELDFLKKLLPQGADLVEVTDDSLRRNRALALRAFSDSKKPLLWHGGGNMGDLWIEQELLRRDSFAALEGKRIISFPQTIFYSDTPEGKALATSSVPFYNGKTGLTLTARESRSFDIMKSIYPDTDVELMPDIVLSTCAETFGVVPRQRVGVLLCLRNDVEKSLSEQLRDELKACLKQLGVQFRMTDMGAASNIITAETRSEIVRRKMQEFCGARLVVTDRLHGMVFAALTGTPCVVFSNYNHKVKSTYDWISYLPFIRYAESLDEAKRVIPELLEMEDCEFDNRPLLPYFEKLKNTIREAYE